MTVFLYNVIVPFLSERISVSCYNGYVPSIERAVLIAYRLQLFFGFAFFFLGSDERVKAFYYEPSYFSISMAIYVSVLFYMYDSLKKIMWFDYFLVVLYLFFSFSASFLLVVFLLFIFYFLRFNLRNFILFFLVGIIFVLYVVFFDDINTVIIRSFFNGDIGFYDILLRGGIEFLEYYPDLMFLRITFCLV
ncbi:hypothetical protein N5P32_00530 [Marinomonas pontica]|uniref:hypothetical protein n=1 Tax=Marinomonas pontica TaxID=264739 RepID=UPI00224497BC|nr:hypothetical protein [Marinomonas pontica]MCW8354476.1 hypothetical protein [Marinomonas pontica]